MNTNVKDFGAQNDGNGIQTKSLQAAIDRCAETGGGIVTFEPGIYVTGTIYLRNGVHLMLPYGCTLRGSTDFADYNGPDDWSENWIYPPEKNNGAHLLVAYNVKDVGIFGGGRIDGSGHVFGYSDEPDFKRPSQMLCFCASSDITLQDLELTNSPYWNCYIYDCEDVIVTRMRIRSSYHIPNRDGIDIDSSRRVVISDCLINSQDDCITFRCCNQFLKDKSHILEDITVTNCQLTTEGCNAFRIGVGCGTIRNCNISNVIIRNSAKGVTIESRYAVFNSDEQPGCTIENIQFNNIFMECRCPVFISSCCEGVSDMIAPPIRNIRFNNITVYAEHHFVIQANNTSIIKDIYFDNMKVIYDRETKFVDQPSYGEWEYFTSTSIFHVVNAQNVKLRHIEAHIQAPNSQFKRLTNFVNSPNAITEDCILE